MDLILYPSMLSGTIRAIPSKSQAHRLLICAALSKDETILHCPQVNEDIEATVRCLNALGANICRTDMGYHIRPIYALPQKAYLDCGESGSTLRFILPIVCALGVETTIEMHGRLPYRPLSPLWEELERMGCHLSRPTDTSIQATGKLRNGVFTINGNVSSQFISGLLFATALMDGKSIIQISGKLESKPYIDMTQFALKTFGVNTENFHVNGSYPFTTSGSLSVEGDWSNAAFFLAAKAMGNSVSVENLNENSPQGDRVVLDILEHIETTDVIDATDIPDLVPILAVTFGTKKNVTFTGISRLRLKESDRITSVCNMINALGAVATTTENTLIVSPGKYHGCTIDTMSDHRIAMAAAIAATKADGPVTILGAECVAKSYPAFWEDYIKLGGHYEQHIR